METYALQWSYNRPHLYSEGKCEQAVDDVLVLAGTAATDEAGNWSADRSIFCLPAGILGRASLVATPTLNVFENEIVVVTPVSLTTLCFYKEGRLEKVGVASLRPDGSAAPNVSFSWQLAVLSTFVK